MGVGVHETAVKVSIESQSLYGRLLVHLSVLECVCAWHALTGDIINA